VGRANEARPHLQLGFDQGVEIHLAGYDLAVALETLGDFPAAAKVIRAITPSEDDPADVWLRLGRLAAEVRAPDVAEPFFRRGVQLAPGDAAARHQFGLDLMLLGRYAEAAVEMAEAARLDPKDPDSLWRLGYCEYQLGRLNDARVHVEAALALNPNDEFAKQLAAALHRIK
jgi:tetratricopeptide (TPR) repeat protein